MRIIIIPVGLTWYPSGTASERMRCTWLAPHLGADIYDGTQDLESYEVIIYNKSYVDERMVRLSEKYKHKLQILDITDHWGERHKDKFLRMAPNFKIFTTATLEPLEELKNYDYAYYIPDRIDLDFFKIRKIHENISSPRLVWFGYSTKFYRIEPLIPYINRKHLLLYVITDEWPGFGIFKRWTLKTSNEDIIKGDIVLNPIGEYGTNKTTTAWALGMPVATNEKEIEQFLDWKERRSEAEKRLKEVKEKWDIRISAREFREIIERHLSKRGEKDETAENKDQDVT